MLRLHDAANAREPTIIARAVQSSGNGRSCRSASVDWIVPPARQADDPRQARLRSRGRGSCRSQRKEYAHKPNDKVTANRHAAADLRSALPAPLPTSASDWMHAHSCFPQCSRTNAATPPLIVSPIVSPNPSQSRDHAGPASRAVAHARVAWVAPNVRVLALVRVRSAPGCSGVVGDRSPAKAAPIRGHKSTRLAHALPDSVPCASSSSSLPIPPSLPRPPCHRRQQPVQRLDLRPPAEQQPSRPLRDHCSGDHTARRPSRPRGRAAVDYAFS